MIWELVTNKSLGVSRESSVTVKSGSLCWLGGFLKSPMSITSRHAKERKLDGYFGHVHRISGVLWRWGVCFFRRQTDRDKVLVTNSREVGWFIKVHGSCWTLVAYSSERAHVPTKSSLMWF